MSTGAWDLVDCEPARQLARDYACAMRRPLVDHGLNPALMDGGTILVLSMGRKPTPKESRLFWQELKRVDQ